MVSYVSHPLPGVTEADSALFARCSLWFRGAGALNQQIDSLRWIELQKVLLL
jgi:hypothetical protein